MGFFKKKEETRPDELPVAGCGSLTYEQAVGLTREIIETFSVEDITSDEEMFYFGFMGGLSFVSMPEDAETFGKSVSEFAKNCFHQTVLGLARTVITRAAQSVLDSLNTPSGGDE